MAMLLVVTMIVQQGAYVLADETVPQPVTETSAAQTETPASEKNTEPAAPAPQPETATPETKAPETAAPETKAPETAAPETKAAETTAPETKAQETQAQIQIPETQKHALYTQQQNESAENAAQGNSTSVPADNGTSGSAETSVPTEEELNAQLAAQASAITVADASVQMSGKAVADGEVIEGYGDIALSDGTLASMAPDIDGYRFLNEVTVHDTKVTSIHTEVVETKETKDYTVQDTASTDPAAVKIVTRETVTAKTKETLATPEDGGEDIVLKAGDVAVFNYEEDQETGKLTAVLVDEFGDTIKGHEKEELPTFTDTLTLDDTNKEPYADIAARISETKVRKYTYVKTTIDGNTVKALKKETVKSNGQDATLYSYTVNGTDWTKIEKDTTIKFIYNGGSKTTYTATSADGSVSVTATLMHADAIPDDAQLVVTPVTASTSGYNYQAYMDALNNTASENDEYTADNTLLVDIAFFTEEVDSNGNETGKQIEVQPVEGSVQFSVSFNNGQLENLGEGSTDADVEVKHLPLNDGVRVSVDSTQQATGISSGDISVENVSASASQEGESANFTLNNLSITAYTIAADDEQKEEDTSSRLADYLDQASLDGEDVTGKAGVTVYGGQDYTFSLHFSETDSLQFPEGTMTYTIPSGIKVPDTDNKKQIDIKGSDSQGDYTAHATYSIKNNVITFDWVKDKAYTRLKAASNAEFSLNFSASFKEDASKIKWSDSKTTDVTVNNDATLNYEKSITRYDKASNRVYYQIKVTSKGAAKDVEVTDTLNGNLVSYSGDKASIYSDKGSTFTEQTPSGSSYTFKLGTLKNGETVTINYSGKLDTTKFKAGDTVKIDSNSNTVTAKGTNTPDGTEKGNQEYTIDMKPSLNKMTSASGTLRPENGSSTVKVPWTIVYNSDGLLSMKGRTITDTIAAESFANGRMKYTGDATVKKYKGSVNEWTGEPNNGTTLISTDTDTFTPDSSKQSWKYAISDEEAYSYVITYYTEVKVDDLNKDIQVSNTGSDGSKSSTSGASVGPAEGNKAGIEKEAASVSETEIDWKITLKVPADGLSKAVVTDYFPIADNYIDELKEISVEDGGLVKGEGFTYQKSIDNKSVKIIFHKADGSEGLSGTVAQRNIVIHVVTTVNQDWLTAASDPNDPNNSWMKSHTNTVKLNGDDTITASATAQPSKKGISKKTNSSNNISVKDKDGNELPAYYFEVTLTGVTDQEFDFTDVYPSTLMFCSATDHGALKVYGGNQYYQGEEYGTMSCTSETEANGQVTATFHVTLNGSATKYSNYKIGYYLQVRDAAAFQTLANTAAKAADGTVDLSNTATFGNSSSEALVKFGANPIEKSIDNDQWGNQYVEEENGYKYLHYTITLNKARATLNNGNPLTLTDTFTNQSIDYTSIHITTVPAGTAVNYDFSGTTGTFTIPDATKVTIKYRCRVDAPADAKGATTTVTAGNSATFEGVTKTTSKDVTVQTSGSGTASNPYITLLKYESGKMNHTLQGAEFDLYDASDMPKPLKHFKTGEDGTVIIEGNQDTDGFTLSGGREFILKETKAPDGYELKTTEYHFKISKKADYSKYIYISGDILKVSNEKKQGSITIKKIVKNATDDDSNHEFKFKVTVNDRTISGQHGAVSFTPDTNEDNNYSVGCVSIKKDESAVITGLPVGTVYKVEEVLSDAQKSMYSSTLSANSIGKIGLDNGEPQAVTVTAANTRLRGGLEISKKTLVDGAEKVTADKFPITISVRNADGSAVVGSFKVQAPKGAKEQTVIFNDKGEASLEITSGETVLFTNLPAGASYSIEEINTEDYTEDKGQESGTSGTIPNGKSAVAVLVNKKEIEKGELDISKTVVSNSSEDSDKSFRFTIVLHGSADVPITADTAKTYSGVTFDYIEKDSSFSKTLSLKNGQTQKIAGLPKDWTYAVTEESAAGFVTTYGKTGNAGTIIGKNSINTVSCTNTKITGSLAITKKVDGTSGDKTKEFSFTITLNNVNAAPSDTGLEFVYDSKTKTASAQFALKDSQTQQISGLASGTEFTVTESGADGYETTYEYSGTVKTGNTYVIGSEGSNTLTVTNTKKMYGGFVVNKVVAGNDPDKKSWFAVKISLNDKTITGQYGDVYFVNGESCGRTKAGSLVDYQEGGQYYDKVYNNKVPAGYVVIKPAESTTKQQATQPIVVWGLPEGITYTVAEDDYSLTYDKSEITGNNEAIKGIVNGTFIPGTTEVPADAAEKVLKAGNIVTVTNTRDRFGKLRIEKHVQDVNGNEVKDSTQSFDFRVRLKDSNDNPITGIFNNGAVVFDKSGTAVVSVQAGQYVEILGLPLRATFTVEELDENQHALASGSGVTGFEAPSYELWYADSASGSKTEKRGTDPSGIIDVKERTVKVINKEESVEVKATKAWQDADGKNIAPKGASVTFALYAKDKNTNRTITLDGIADQNGESTAWVADFGKLPKYSFVSGKTTEITYTVRETGSVPGYVAVNNNVENNGTITNRITSIKLQKVDGSGNALSGAHLQILDQDKKVITEWDTDGSVKTITGLNYGYTYTIHETKAPADYRLASDTTFTIKSDGAIDTENTTCVVSTVDGNQVLTVTDIKNIKVLKTDDSGKALSGAALEIDDENGTPIESWTSGESAHVIEAGLEAGKTYMLKETSAPEGYSTIAAATFSISPNGSIADVSSSDGKVTVQEGDTFQLNAKDTYAAEGSVTISASKTLTGAKLRNGQFTFLLKDANGDTLQSKTNDAAGAITFDPISYSHSDVANSPITYQVTEQNDNTNGFTYDSSVYTVQVTLTDDGKGTITATPVYYKGDAAEANKVDNISFANTYSSEGSTMIQATKNLIGNNLQKDEFSFSLTGDKVDQSKTNEADGNISFDTISYNQDDITNWNEDGTGTGTKKYTLKENKGDLSYVQYDGTEYTITVNLADNGNGHIEATQQITKNGGAVQSAVFDNVYTSEGTVIIGGSKTLEGGILRENEFSFLLEETDADGKVLTDGIEKTAVNDAAGNFYFEQIPYTLDDIDPTTRVGVKYYKVTEVKRLRAHVWVGNSLCLP